MNDLKANRTGKGAVKVNSHQKGLNPTVNPRPVMPVYKHYHQVSSTKQYQNEYLRKILNRALQSDKWRSKLVKMSNAHQVDKLERIFPHASHKQFVYVGSGSYAHVYRCKTDTDKPTTNHECEQQSSNPSSSASSEQSTALSTVTTVVSDTEVTEEVTDPTTWVIKLIDVYSENILKSFNGTSARSSVSTYKDAYNEFKVSLYLSYLNVGLNISKNYYKCGTFPDVYEIYVVNDSVPEHFDSSAKVKQIEYGKLFPKNKDDEDESSLSKQCRSKPSVRDLATTKPEIALIKMEDCGVPIGDVLSKLRPLQTLSLAKQLLLGFMVAEKVFEFEHRDLHLGNIMVKQCKQETLCYLYCDKVIYVPSHNLQTKVIDTTFSRLKFKSKVFFRNLSHLFNEKDMDKHKSNPLSHQDQTYRGMAAEVKNDWSNHYPRSNLVWSIYIMKKLLHSRPLRKEITREAIQVRNLLRTYVSIMFEMNSMHQFFSYIYQQPGLNRYVPIKMEDIL